MQFPKSRKFTIEKLVKLQRIIRRTSQVHLLMIMGFSKVLDKETSVFDPKKEAVVSSIIEDMREGHDLGSLHGLSLLENQMIYLYHSM